jgi:hypothetical protein
MIFGGRGDDTIPTGTSHYRYILYLSRCLGFWVCGVLSSDNLLTYANLAQCMPPHPDERYDDVNDDNKQRHLSV